MKTVELAYNVIRFV